MNKIPSVVIIGRINVGKSTLFNRLSVDVKSLTLDYPGVTRDFIKDIVCWQDRCFELIDTGGISLRKTDDPILEKTRQVALAVLQRADLVLFVCDGQVGVVSEDHDIARELHHLGKKVLLVINKSDSKIAQERIYEFQCLGHKSSIPISAQHGIGIDILLEAIVEQLPIQETAYEEEQVACKVVLLGKPNVGKSSLMNLLLQQERSIVSEQPGTTREAISERIAFYKEDIQITDTPGVRKKKAVTQTLEGMMVKQAFKAVEDTDVILLLVDGSEGKISDQELKLAFYTFEQRHKALILLVNKQDLMDEVSKGDLAFSLEEYEYFAKKIEKLNISCKTGANTGKILPLVHDVCKRYHQRFSDEEITRIFKEGLQHKPLYHRSYELNIKRAHQIKTAPITILMYVNVPEWYGPSQLAFFEGLLRQHFDLKGIPVKFIVRKK